MQWPRVPITALLSVVLACGLSGCSQRGSVQGGSAQSLLPTLSPPALTSPQPSTPPVPQPVGPPPTTPSAMVQPSTDESPSPAGGTESSAASPAGADSPCAQPLAPGDVVWIDTPAFVHDKDFHDLSAWVDPDVGSNWSSPVDYANGDVTICIEIISVADPAAVPIYYLVGWGPGDGGDTNGGDTSGGDGYIRGGARFDSPSGVVSTRLPVKQYQRVENGYDAGDVGDQWDWSRAVSSPNGDTWGAVAPYPMTVRLRLTLHPAAG